MSKKKKAQYVQPEPPKKKREIWVFHKIMMVFTPALSILMLILFAIERSGLSPIMADLDLKGCLLMVWSLLAWGGAALWHLLKHRIPKIVGGICISFILMFVGIFALTYLNQYTQLVFPHQYAVLTGANHTAVVLRAVDTGFGSEETVVETNARMNERRDAIIASGEEVEEGEYPEGAFGYVYTAYPRRLMFFYDRNADSEGKLFVGLKSAASVHYEWMEDGNALRLYLEDAEIGDSGEVNLNF